MGSLSEYPDLKEINALKKRLNWGDVHAIYQMVSSSVSDLDGILSHGFDSAYKNIFNKNNWNIELLEGFTDQNNTVQVKIKPQISLQHVYGQMGYELHCFPIVANERLSTVMINNPQCPFKQWLPEGMQMLFRINSFVPYAIYAYQNGDEADMALIKHTFLRVEELINILRESFDVIDVKGFNIAEFYQEIHIQKGDVLIKTP